MIADILGKDNRTDMVTNGYRFVAIFIILGAKETEGKFHAVLSFFARRHKSSECACTSI